MKLFCKNKLIFNDLKVANTFLSRFLGLMGKKSLPEGSALLISPCKMVHNCFMRFSIDILFIDSKNKIVGLCPGLRPWRLSPFIKNSKSVIECNKGIISRFDLSIGDLVEIKP